MEKRHVQDFRIFDINFRLECDKNYPMLFELEKFAANNKEIDYTYYISMSEMISETETITHCNKDFNICQEENITKRKFLRYDTKTHNQKYGVQLSYQNNGNKLDIIFAEKYFQRFQNTIILMQYMGIERILIQNQGLLLHASLIEYKGYGIAFTAPSGTGKSTQAELWNKYRKAEIINGDRAGIRKTNENEFWAYGSPIAGSSGIIKNQKIKLSAIVVLRQAKENRIKKMRPVEAFSALYSETLLNLWDEKYMSTVSDLLIEMVQLVPVYILYCRPDEDAVVTLEKELGI